MRSRRKYCFQKNKILYYMIFDVNWISDILFRRFFHSFCCLTAYYEIIFDMEEADMANAIEAAKTSLNQQRKTYFTWKSAHTYVHVCVHWPINILLSNVEFVVVWRRGMDIKSFKSREPKKKDQKKGQFDNSHKEIIE